MHAPLNSQAGRRRPLAVAAAAVIVAISVGCDTSANRADRAAAEQVAEARDTLAKGGDAAQARQLLESAAGSATNATTKVQAKSLLGQVLMRDARDLAWEVDRLDRDAQRLCTEITQLAGQVQLSAQLAAGYAQLNPQPVTESLRQRADEARGGADRPVWFESDGVKFPSLTAASQQISRLEGEVAAKQEEIRQLESQRVAALKAADEAAAVAEQSTGRASVEATTRSSNARRQASDLGTQIEMLNASLQPILQQLAIANAQKQYVSNAAAQLDQQSKLLQQGWETIQKSGAQQAELAKRITSETGKGVNLQPIEGVQVQAFPAASIEEKAARLAEIVAQADEKRARLIEMLGEAAKHLGDAAQAAVAERGEIQRIQGENPSAPAGQQAAWKATRNALSPGLYQVDQAEAFRMLAATHQNHASILQARIKSAEAVRTALEAAGLPVPAPLQNGALMEKYTTAMKEADAAYKEADDLLDSVVKGNAELEADRGAVASARPQRLYGLYRWSVLAADMGDTEAAKAHLESAKNEIADAVNQQVRLPRLPPELQAMLDEAVKASAPPPAPPASETPAPEGQPPVEPEAKPAEGAEPAPPPVEPTPTNTGGGPG